MFKDINDDGREDLLLILGGITDLELHKIIIYDQNEMGGFEVNIKMTRKINKKMNKAKKYSIQNIIDCLARIIHGSITTHKICRSYHYNYA